MFYLILLFFEWMFDAIFLNLNLNDYNKDLNMFYVFKTFSYLTEIIKFKLSDL